MIISRIYGGLGNQMFQYAIARRYALLFDTNLKLDIFDFDWCRSRTYLLSHYNVKGAIAALEDIKKYRINKFFLNRCLHRFNIRINKHIYYEKKHYSYDTKLVNKFCSEMYLVGYWQCFKYFEDIREYLLNDFTLKTELNEENKEYLDLIKNCNSVSIHIRRGDYISNYKYKYANLPLDYYRKSVEFINRKINEPIYYIFSDEPEWVKENLHIDGQIRWVDFNSPLNSFYDMYLMSHCKHNIIANSSFSWWGGWLNTNNEKVVIAPYKWLNYSMSLEHLIPNTWVVVEF